jgi:integrase
LDIKQRRYDPTITEEKVHYLTPEQLQQFMRLYHSMNRIRSKEIMEIFLFTVNTALRVSDIITLEWKHIDFDKKELRKVMYKTKIPVTVHLNDDAMDILSKWKKRCLNSRFVFDLLDEEFDLTDTKRLDTLRLSKNRTIQNSLKSIGTKLKLPFNLTIHVGRHTFAVLCLKKGLDVYQISKLLGHSSIVATEKTYAEYLPKDFKEMAKQNLEFGISIRNAS